jgi:site-specific DNA-methyltransferase (adenine-specific)
LDAESVDAIVCDPPYGLSFMGKDWDHGVPGEAFWREALRVAKPGAHLVAFGGTRTYHRLTCAIEDAGWEIRDCLSWLYGSGFPKSLDVSKAMDAKIQGRNEKQQPVRSDAVLVPKQGKGENTWNKYGDGAVVSSPATDLARQWHGWGTALKPAWEPIILARKPLIGTVAANVAQYGTGGINVDGCRIETGGESLARPFGSGGISAAQLNAIPRGTITGQGLTGRWPANVVLDEEAAGLLDEQSGKRKSSGVYSPHGSGKTVGGIATNFGGRDTPATMYGDSGGASRFFYCAKSSRREREAGLEGMPERVTERYGEQGQGPTPQQTPREHKPAANVHPTVKPIALMRWLCRLVTPKGGLILDPFTGSGTTGCAAVLEGFRFVGVEREPEYAAIAEARIAHWAAQTPTADLFTEAL